MKKILFVTIIIFLVIIIYIINIDKKELVFKIGDSLSLSINSYNISSYDEYVKEYLINEKKYEDYIIYGKSNYKIGELQRDIKNNIDINDRHIQNILIKADLIILEIGIDDLKNILSNNNNYIYEYLDGIGRNMEELVKLIRSYCKEKILLVGYYNLNLNNNNEEYINYINNIYKSISNKYDIYYLDVDFLNSSLYFSNPDNHYLNDKGYKLLNEEIIKLIYSK